MPRATDHVHHRTHGDTDEPSVSQQTDPLWEAIHALRAENCMLANKVAELEMRLVKLLLKPE